MFEEDNFCFCCGKENPIGLKLDIRERDGIIETELTVRREFQGYKNILHGGFISMLLDEVMAHAAFRKTGKKSVATGKIEVSFKKPIFAGEKIKVYGKVDEEKGKIIKTSGKILNSKSEIAASAKAIFIKIKEN